MLVLLAGEVLMWMAPTATLAYTYGGACNGQGDITWDFVTYAVSGTDGVEMDQYQVPSSSSWKTCTGATGYGHVDELLSLQGTGDEIVQVGIAKYISSGNTSWLFIYTPNDNTNGVVVDAGSKFGEEPISGRTYYMHIENEYVGPYYVWTYCIKDFTNGHEACWDGASTWHSSTTFMWFGGETADRNSTMGAHGQSSDFRTYALRRHSISGVWGSYFANSYIDGHCGGEGYNASIVNCNSITTNGFGGFYIWTP